MARITLYRQARRDGGLRTGIVVDDQTYYSRLDGLGEDFDPRLDWFIDLACEGESLPSEPEAARRWLVDHAPPIRSGLLELAKQLRPGLDLDLRPYRHEVPGAPEGVRISIACAANRRLPAHRISEDWAETIRGLPGVPREDEAPPRLPDPGRGTPAALRCRFVG